MARRSWFRSILGAVLAAAGAAAAQLGIGYGVGVITFAAPETATGVWLSGLTWAVWIAATSVVIGAVVGDRLAGSSGGGFGRAAWRLVVAFAAAIGSLVAVPLVGVPASRVHIADNFAPHLLAGVYAAAGVVAGLVAALLALTSRAVATNVLVSAVWLWALAIVAVVDAAPAGPGFGQLAIWRFTDEGPIWHGLYVPGALLVLGAALLFGGLAAFPAAVRGDGLIGVAISGGVGPALVLLAYALTRPTAGRASFDQVSTAAVAPYLVVAGLVGSVLVAAVGGMSSRPRRARSEGPEMPRRTAARTPAPPPPAPAPASPSPTPPAPPPPSRPPAPPASGPASPPSGATGTASVPPTARAVPEPTRTGGLYQGGTYQQQSTTGGLYGQPRG